MALLYSSHSDLGSIAADFQLPSVDGQTISLATFANVKGLLIVFMCNHCPYVVAVHARLSALAREFASKGIAVLGINSNDPNYREADSFENMKIKAHEWNLVFPYAFDESQSVAKAYDAQCTPDPYLFQKTTAGFSLVYRGRIDDNWKDEAQVQLQDLRVAMQALSDNQKISEIQMPSMGCSIKWKI